MEDKKKIFVMVLPSIGHINPISGFVEELIKRKKYEIIFYGNAEHKDIIEKTGAEFRLYPLELLSNCKVKPLNEDKYDVLSELFNYMIDHSYKAVPIYIEHIQREKPELIIYDHFSFPARYTVRILETRYRLCLSKIPPPLAINFYTCFACKKNVYPLDHQIKETLGSGFRLATTLAKLIYKQTLFSWKFGIDIYNPVKFIYNETESLNIVTVFPELHPYSNQYGSNFKFVGCCVSEKLRKQQVIEPELKEILDLFEPLNPNFSNQNDSKKNKLKLVYASLGTVFTNNLFIFDIIIDSIKCYNQVNANLDSNQLRVVISLGKENYEIYRHKILNENFKVPNNVLLIESVPQIDLLERASLFITHCGMNSASEAIQYGVPVVCLPIKCDQPLVADRLADDLNLGIKFDPLKMNANDLKMAIETILNDNSYLNRVLSLTKVSRNYDGKVLSADLVEQFINRQRNGVI